jgi:limonene-1,2-epoxide hydrolase
VSRTRRLLLDGTYHHDGEAGKHGNLRVHRRLLKGWTATEDINTVSRGDVVIAERLDRTRLGEKKSISVRWRFRDENGRIKVWRDYFDLATFTKAVA